MWVTGAGAAQTAMLITAHLFPQVTPLPLETLISLLIHSFTNKQLWLLPPPHHITDTGPGAQSLMPRHKDSGRGDV